MTALETAAAVRDGHTTATALARSAIAAAQADPHVAVTRILADRALAEAVAVDAQVARGEDPGPLAGVPYAVKDLFDVAGLPTTAGAAMLADALPATRDAEAIARMRAAGAVLVATTNMDAFAYGFATINAAHGTTRNPHDPARLAGGSSGGAAAVVAAGMVPLSLGSDTNGSIRVPAALCGLWGLKPTHGSLPLAGVYPFVDSFDDIGPFATTLADLELAWRVLGGTNLNSVRAEPVEGSPERPPQADSRRALPFSSRARKKDSPSTSSGQTEVRVAKLGGWFTQNLSPTLAQALDHHFAHLPTVTLPQVDRARSAAYIMTAAEGGTRHLPELRRRAMAFDPQVRDRLIAGALTPAAHLVAAQAFRETFRAAAADLFAQHDVLIAPCVGDVAPTIADPNVTLDGQRVPARAHLGLYTQPLSFIGLPVIAAPLHRPGRLPLGLQLVGRPGGEAALFACAARLEARGICRTSPLPS